MESIWGGRPSQCATTHPPNPAPVRRAPYIRCTPIRASTKLSSLWVDTSKSRAKLKWLSYMTSPASCNSPDLSSEENVYTRWHSVTTCRIRLTRTVGDSKSLILSIDIELVFTGDEPGNPPGIFPRRLTARRDSFERSWNVSASSS